MGRKVTGIRIDIGGETFRVRGMSKTRAGASFTLRARPRLKLPESKAQLKLDIAQEIAEILAD